jgi:hypothetical protein
MGMIPSAAWVCSQYKHVPDAMNGPFGVDCSWAPGIPSAAGT